jgi:hypothetical protein
MQNAFKALGGHITSLNRSKGTSGSVTNEHALQSIKSKRNYSSVVDRGVNSSDEGLVTTATGPRSHPRHIPITYDLEAHRITKEVHVSWYEDKRYGEKRYDDKR